MSWPQVIGLGIAMLVFGGLIVLVRGGPGLLFARWAVRHWVVVFTGPPSKMRAVEDACTQAKIPTRVEPTGVDIQLRVTVPPENAEAARSLIEQLGI